MDRQKYDHTAKTTDEQKASTKKAILNKDFRQAVNFAFDRKSYAAQVSGADAAENTLRSTLVTTNLCPKSMEKILVKVVEKQLVTYGDQWKGVSLADGQTSLYNPEKKPKLHLRKLKLNCKTRRSIPNSFGLYCQPSGQQHGPTS